MDDAVSEAESAPPPPNGQPVPAAQHPQHPLWARAAGQGGPQSVRAKPKGRAGTTTVNGKFVPISMAALELRARNEFDGASSAASTRGEPAAARKRSRARREEEEGDSGAGGANAGERQREEPPRDYDDVDNDDEEGEENDDDASQSDVASGADVMAGAAFGGGGGGGPRHKKSRLPRSKRCGDCTTLSVASDTDDGVSISSSQQREAHRRAFPVSGVECVGCALPAKVVAVDDFVRTSCDKMQETALFKMAALIYQQKVAEPALAEDVPVPSWAWKDIRAHYTMHRMDPRMQRFENMRTLAAMRKTLELTLLREDESSGEHVLDKGNAEQIMKIITLQSKEITLLHEATHGAGTGAKGGGTTAGQLPAGAASKKRD